MSYCCLVDIPERVAQNGGGRVHGRHQPGAATTWAVDKSELLVRVLFPL